MNLSKIRHILTFNDTEKVNDAFTSDHVWATPTVLSLQNSEAYLSV